MSQKIDARYLYDTDNFLKGTKHLLTDESIVSGKLSDLGVRRKCFFQSELINEPTLNVGMSVVEIFSGEFVAGSEEVVVFENKEVDLRVLINDLNCGAKYYYKVLAEIQTPEQIKGSQVLDSDFAVLESEVLNVRFVFCSFEFALNRTEELSWVYDSFSELGFFATDLDMLDDYFSKLDSKVGNDLIEEFTTTELAGDIFKEGLGILCWGGTPWIYFVRSEDNCSIYGESTGYEGNYFLREDIKELSVIPGEALRDWSLCRCRKWPKLKVYGEGRGLSVKLLIKNELTSTIRENTGIFSPILSYVLVRHNGDSNSNPLLYSRVF
ncbi:hypothetical protein [Shewanella chilikensis]|uniref:hypothetical protein n=1 Tax=Shewanella chilikensis TaxID=558541 RepID=UPI001F3C6BDB|nr:hypothetical protein [Shewanella chilikensis]MCE9852790.1 hypothetical protein [Shewanella chilikensis]